MRSESQSRCVRRGHSIVGSLPLAYQHELEGEEQTLRYRRQAEREREEERRQWLVEARMQSKTKQKSWTGGQIVTHKPHHSKGK